MTSVLSPIQLSKFSHFVSEEIGLYFPKEKWSDLERGVLAASKAFQFDDMESCINWLLSSSLNQKQIEILASFLTVGETYFFRDPTLFRVLEEKILPPLIYKRYSENKKNLRIWSAGCATGEEPYSLAIILNKVLPDIKNWNITLLATDINTGFLKKLSKGVYSEWSFRGVSDDIKTSYFKKKSKGTYEILPSIKGLVEPFYLNLSRDIYPSLINNTNAMDIIVCRNVLMYFSPKLIQTVTAKFYDCLVDNGCLIVAPGEMTQTSFSNFTIEFENGATCFRKNKLEKIEAVNLQTELPLADINLEVKTSLSSDLNFKSLTQECANQGKLKEALTWNDKAISENKTDPDLYYLRAMILLELGHDEEAITALKRVHYLNPDFVLAYVVMGNIFHKQRRKREANKYFDHALSLLRNINPDEILGDITAGRLSEVIHLTKDME